MPTQSITDQSVKDQPVEGLNPKQKLQAVSRSTFSLGILQLDLRYSRLMVGKMYALVAEFFDYRRALLQQLDAGEQTLVIICKTPPEKLLQQHTEAQRQFSAKVAEGRILLYQLQESSFGHMGRRAVQRMINEIENYVRPRNALIVFENGGDMLGVSDAANVERIVGYWKKWLNRSRCSVLFIITDVNEDVMINSNLHFIQDQLNGLALLGLMDNQLKLSVQHWYSAQGLTADVSFEIQHDNDGFMVAYPEPATISKQAQATTVDVESVWTVRAVVTGEEYPPSWSVSETMEQLVSQSESAIAGTLVLPYHQETGLEQLAHFVWEVRRRHGKRLKIIIRETSTQLRHSQERLLRHLGATLIVPVDVVFSRLLGIIESVGDLVFDGEVSDDFEQAFILANPDRKQGYLAPQVFIVTVQQLIAQSRSFGIKYGFIKLTLSTGMKVREVLRICQIRRPGDVCTADDHHIYLFLFGCRETDITRALGFIFNMPINQLFEHELRDTHINTTLLSIEELQREVELKNLPDHSQWLAAHQLQSGQQKDDEKSVFQYRQSGAHFIKKEPISAVRISLAIKKSPDPVADQPIAVDDVYGDTGLDTGISTIKGAE